MAVIAPIVYRDKQPQVPVGLAKYEAIARLDFRENQSFPTFDIGYTHVYRIRTFGLTRDAAETESKKMRARFMKKMNQVEGFKLLKQKLNDGYIPVNGNHSFTWMVEYAVERTDTRTQNPDSPYPEYQRDISRLMYTPETASVLRRG